MCKIVAILFLCACTTLAAAQRSFTFAYALTMKDVPAGAHLVDIWLPVPHDDAFQSITNVRVETPASPPTTGRRAELFRVSLRRSRWRQIHHRGNHLLVHRCADMIAAGAMKPLLRWGAALGLMLVLIPVAAPQRPPLGPPQTERDTPRLPNGKIQQEEILKADHERDLKDAAQLIELAEGLKEELEKNDQHVLSLSSLKKTEEIEKLAKRIRSRLRR
jgi:hypothetical protein